MTLDITDFALRHFNKKGAGTKITDHTYDEFMEKWGDYFSISFEHLTKNSGSLLLYPHPRFCRLINGDKPHIKYFVIKNFTDANVGVEKITNENYQYLRSGYSARRDSELPVLTRWFELPLQSSKAEYLILVLYSKEQLKIEHEKGPDADGTPFNFESEWGVVAILGQNHPEPDHMTPITVMRNALGIEEGGSGVAIDKDYYEKSVNFWESHALVR